MKRFENKTILITGGTSGIGLAGAEILIKEGAKVIITGRTESHLKSAAEKLGKDVIVVNDNAEDNDSPERLVSIVKEYGKIDGLWLNAAYAVGGDISSMDREMIDRMFKVNVTTPMLQMGALSPYIKNKGAVLVTSSSAVYEGQSSVSLYSATKAAILAAARCWATELAPRNIRVNSLIPGPIKSNLRSGLPDELRQQFEDELAKTIPLKRIGEPDEAGAVAAFLLSDESSYVTGSSYVVDGGLLKI
ncbi:SDR family NAD(P)-dependent oxidoreductase [Pontibacter silvestris]|uniref:SDR family NAD(P)-dependent oxidoreductase n=1 Tax=Pontibacter silvestris TaxID=2305183 RepID=A0ABW4X3A0_9BACT|nr:SDR family oxidoreductase [Pontibacter silvestris]MCC9138427.1 SDR family oxidoreductase [Pontibacter silvestris]